jgi:hypothetical protein
MWPLVGICKEIAKHKGGPVMPSDHKSFYFYFKENMEALGLPAPESLFGTLTTALATIGSLAAPLKEFGAQATMGQLAKLAAAGSAACPAAAIICDKALVLAGCAASYYVGACIGSLAVATGRSLSGGMSIADLFDCAKSHGIPTSPELQKTLIAFPEICNADLRGNVRIAVRMAQWAKLPIA